MLAHMEIAIARCRSAGRTLVLAAAAADEAAADEDDDEDDDEGALSAGSCRMC